MMRVTANLAGAVPSPLRQFLQVDSMQRVSQNEYCQESTNSMLLSCCWPAHVAAERRTWRPICSVLFLSMLLVVGPPLELSCAFCLLLTELFCGFADLAHPASRCCQVLLPMVLPCMLWVYAGD